ncbi:hypothetical protein [Nocardioides sp. LS1]|uniref:hypothetical protein n=1 Tax=Nocardioides sp. LS1 TaxID=1027620 RepID=UPI000F623D96|nr:hypothetical protein [Nocardioides sp. LS1]GCD88771.1 hypothetical protein NLS1_07770 [Nocardioides sp. LS1]
MAEAKCAICGVNDASGVGEHVWPKWFLKQMDASGKPPNAWSRNGKPILKPGGQQVKLPQRTRVFLPVCIPCNNKLGARFEDPAVAAIKQLAANRWAGSHSATEWRAVGMWWAKIGLMLGHTAASYNHRDLNDQMIRFEGRPPDYSWMVDGSPPPNHLSVFVHHTSMQAGETEAVLGVPEHVQRFDGSVSVSHVFQIATPDLAVAVVSHPGMTIVHPLVERGEAWELLRDPPLLGDLASLPQFGHRRVVFRQGLLVNEGFQIDSSETSRLLSIFAHEIEQAPEVYPGYQPEQPQPPRWRRVMNRVLRRPDS